MTVNIPEELAQVVQAEVSSGHFASEDELVAAALRDYLQRICGRPAPSAAAGSGMPGQELDTQDLQHRLVEAGVLSEVKLPITDLAAYQNRRAVPIEGEALSDTVIRERR